MAAATAKWASLTDAAVAAEGSSSAESEAIENEDGNLELGDMVVHDFSKGGDGDSALPSQGASGSSTESNAAAGGGSSSAVEASAKDGKDSQLGMTSGTGGVSSIEGGKAVSASISSPAPLATAAKSVADPSPQRCPPLTRDLLQRTAKDNAIMFGLLNSAQLDFGLNWAKHVQHIGLSYYLVGALDSNTSSLLASMKVVNSPARQPDSQPASFVQPAGRFLGVFSGKKRCLASSEQ
jgi:hypothetical protein